MCDRARPEDRADTDAWCASCFSFASSRSRRELISPCTLVGTGTSLISSPLPPLEVEQPSSRSIRTVSSRKSGLPPAFAISVSANGVSAKRGVAEEVGRGGRRPARRRASEGRSCAAGPPCRGSRAPSSRELRPRRADERERRSVLVGEDVRDQLEQRRLGPVQVLEHDRRRLLAGAAAAARGGCPSAARPARSRSSTYVPRGVVGMPIRLESADAIVRSSSRSSVGSVSRNASSFAALVSRSSLCRIPAADLKISVDGPVRDALAVGEAAPPVHGEALLEAVRELVQEAALADAGHADDRREPGGALLGRRDSPNASELGELGVAADERRLAPRSRVRLLLRPDDLPDLDRLRLALRLRSARRR